MKKHEQVATYMKQALEFHKGQLHSKAAECLKTGLILIGTPKVQVDKRLILGASQMLLAQLWSSGQQAECFELMEKVYDYEKRGRFWWGQVGLDNRTPSGREGLNNLH